MSTKADKNEEQRLQQFHLSQRLALNNAYGALEGDRHVQTFAAFTFEDAASLQLEWIKGDNTSQIRPNQLERVDNIEGQLLKAVEALKAVPPELFLSADELRDVNTPET